MAIAHKKKFGLGLGMLIGFFVVIVMLFMPIYGTLPDGSGKNAFNLLDGLYNSVSKSSSDFNEETLKSAEEFNGQETSFNVKVSAPVTDNVDGMTDRGTMAKSDVMAQQMVKQVQMAGGNAEAKEKDGKWTLKVTGDLGAILTGAIEDSKVMYENKNAELQQKYGFDGESALLNWWIMFNSPQADLNDQGGQAFEQSKMLKETNEKSIEPAYNYYNIEAKSPGEEAIPILLSLGGYVLYTVWYGFALLFMFEGWGLKLEH